MLQSCDMTNTSRRLPHFQIRLLGRPSALVSNSVDRFKMASAKPRCDDVDGDWLPCRHVMELMTTSAGATATTEVWIRRCDGVLIVTRHRRCLATFGTSTMSFAACFRDFRKWSSRRRFRRETWRASDICTNRIPRQCSPWLSRSSLAPWGTGHGTLPSSRGSRLGRCSPDRTPRPAEKQHSHCEVNGKQYTSNCSPAAESWLCCRLYLWDSDNFKMSTNLNNNSNFFYI